MDALHNRRVFLRAAIAASVTWTAVEVFDVEDALAHAAEQAVAAPPAALRVLTRAQANVIDALAARILPSVDGRPGAREAGALYFIDRALATFNAGQRQAYADGVADLNRRAASLSPSGRGFAGLTPQEQDGVIHEIETSPFFQAVRFDTIVGTFALPTYGGNRDYAGWHLIGLDHRPRFQAPFGFYDADANRRV